MNTQIEKVRVVDLRVPTSDNLLGSDPFHRKPNYSALLVTIETNNTQVGSSLAFTLGAGNDWVGYAVKDLSQLIIETTLEAFIENPHSFQQTLLEHHQLRWLADGLHRMAVGAIVNAMWDLWAKHVRKPLWKLLVDLPPEKVIQCIDWRYLEDVLTQDEALEILNRKLKGKIKREDKLYRQGVKAYSTAGWSGLTDIEIVATIDRMKRHGFNCFKMKVGGNLKNDHRRLSFIRKVVGNDAPLMLDANQIWGVDEAIDYMQQLAQFHPTWIEEPTARDDVLGYIKISQEMAKLDIGVAAGEQIPSPVLFKQFLASGALSYCQIDATRLGGVNDILPIILMACKYGVPVCPHGGGIGLCNMIQHYSLWDQICVATHSRNQIVEYLDFLQDGVFIHPVRVKDGSYCVPEALGWGLEMHSDFVRKHTYPQGLAWTGREASGGVLFLA